MFYENTREFALKSDKEDNLGRYRKQFLFPQHEGKDVIYFCGNSLGLLPETVKRYVKEQLADWEKYGVESHIKGDNPWYSYEEKLSEKAAPIVGALPSEVVLMNQLTVNLHLLMVSFYRPSPAIEATACGGRPSAGRYKILCEAKAFPSDLYAMQSQVKFHGFNPENVIICVSPRPDEICIRHEDILSAIEKNKDELALILIGGVNYYTGQVFDMKSVTEAGHKAGAVVGFDLAHAAGNIKLSLHDWNVDFACWCTYKYLNSGPGGVGGVFIHQRHADSFSLPRFTGWWGHDKATRFRMDEHFQPMKGAEGWQISNPPILSMAVHKAALDIFEEAGMDALVEKSKALTGYLEFVIDKVNGKINDKKVPLKVITPSNESERGCQLSVLVGNEGKIIFDELRHHGVIADWREPGVIRLAPVPLYNSFEDVYGFGKILQAILAI